MTGASSDLGKELIFSLLEKEYIVFGVSLDGVDLEVDLPMHLQRKLDDYVERFNEHYNDHYNDILCDLRDDQAVVDLFGIIQEKTSELDVVVHLAGHFTWNGLKDIEVEEWQTLLQTNVTGVFHLLKSLYPFLKPKDSHLLFLTNPAGEKSLPMLGAYGATQAAAKSLFQSAEVEWADLNCKFSYVTTDPFVSKIWDHIDLPVNVEDLLTVNDVVDVLDFMIHAPQKLEFSHITLRSKNLSSMKTFVDDSQEFISDLDTDL